MKTLLLLLCFTSCALSFERLHYLDLPWTPPRHSGSLLKIVYNENSPYHATVKIGLQYFKMFFDLNFDQVAVLSNQCTSLSCAWKKTFNGKPENENPVELSVFGHEVFGLLTKNNTIVGEITFEDSEFYQVINETNNPISSHYDGVFGLGNTEGAFMTKQKKLMTLPVVSLSLKKEHGYIIFGGTVKDTTQKYFPTKNNAQWSFQMTFIESKDRGFKYWCGSGCMANLSSTEEGIVGPREDVKSVHKYIGVTKVGNQYTVDCDTIEQLPTLTFHIYGSKYTLEGRHYTKKVTSMYGKKMCVSLLKEAEVASENWTLGRAFLEKFIVTFAYTSPRQLAFSELHEFNMYKNLKMSHIF